MKKLVIGIIGIIFSVNISYSQNIAITDDDGYSPESSAMLDVKSTTKGLLVPRLTTTEREAISSPAAGLLVYDTILKAFYFYNGTSWIDLSSGSAGGQFWSYTSPNIYMSNSINYLGLGTSSPLHKLHLYQSVAVTDGTDGNFIDIQNSNASTGVMSGIRFFNGTTANTVKGGIFYQDALSFGRGNLILANRSLSDQVNVSAEDARIILENTGRVMVKGDPNSSLEDAIFAVQNSYGDTVFAVYPEGVRVNVYDDPNATRASSTKGGFVVGGYNREVRGATYDFLTVSPDEVRVKVEENDIARASTTKGGFVVGGFNRETRGETDYLNVYGSNTADVISSEARIFWYPLKEAFLVGRIHVGSADSVGTNSFASGYHAIAKGNWSQALGYQTKAFGDYSTAIGKNSIASALNSFAFGAGAKATGVGSYAFGSYSTDTLGNQTGTPTEASGIYSIAFGQGAKAQNLNDMSFGTNSIANGSFSTAFGYNSQATGKWAIAMGKDVISSGERSLAIGPPGWFFGELATRATANFATALGVGAQATAAGATSLGVLCFASGEWSVAVGVAAQASAYYSFATSGSNASGENSIAMGGGNASADYSVSIGQSTGASGLGALSAGYNSTASGDYAVSIGYTTVAQSYNSFVVGRHAVMRGTKTSWVDTDDLFVVGNGTATSDRKNALTVLKNAKMGINNSAPESYLHITTADGYAMKGIIVDTDSDASDYPFRIRTNSASTGHTDADTKFYIDGTGEVFANGGVTFNGGTEITKLQHGTYTVGTGTGGVKTVTITFPSTFTGTPKVNVTVKGGNFTDVFAVTTRNVGTSSFQVNIYRVDSPGGLWAQTLYLDWMAWE